MEPQWFREGQYIAVDRLEDLLGEDMITRLMAAGILTAARCDDTDFDGLPVDVPQVRSVKFSFCGTLLAGDVLIKCYPKYHTSEQAGRSAFPHVMAAIQKYDRSRRQRIYGAAAGESNGSILPIVIALIEDYCHNGLYQYNRQEMEINGPGETDWQSTIDRHNPVMVNSRPVYMQMETYRTRNDLENFFRQVHMAVLDECSDVIRRMDLGSMMPVQGIRFLENKLDALGSTEHILRRLRQERASQFLAKRQNTLRLLMMYLERRHNSSSRAPIVFYGTTAMNMVWEKALAEVLDNQLDFRIGNIQALDEEARRSFAGKDRTLMDYIEHPVWRLPGGGRFLAETLRPDTVSIKDGEFIIYDAKYYVPSVKEDSIAGQPGLDSVTKQYMYHMAYEGFLEYFHIGNAKNVFLIPHEPAEDGSVSWPMASVDFRLLSRHTGGVGVDCLYVDADAVWRAYADGQRMML